MVPCVSPSKFKIIFLNFTKICLDQSLLRLLVYCILFGMIIFAYLSLLECLLNFLSLKEELKIVIFNSDASGEPILMASVSYFTNISLI
jgi:hypothetical protein